MYQRVLQEGIRGKNFECWNMGSEKNGIEFVESLGSKLILIFSIKKIHYLGWEKKRINWFVEYAHGRVAVSPSCRNSHVVEGTTIVTKFGNPTRQVRSWIGFEDLEKEKEEEDQTSDTNSRTVAVNRPCLRTLGNVDARRKLSTNEIKFHSVAIPITNYLLKMIKRVISLTITVSCHNFLPFWKMEHQKKEEGESSSSSS